jgi:hypothetical protein
MLVRTGASIAAVSRLARGDDDSEKQPPTAPPHKLIEITGSPRERGRMYGRKFNDGIHAFLEREIYARFAPKPADREPLLEYAGACWKAVRAYSPEIADELESVAEATDLRVEEIVLITSHEELYHNGKLPKIQHCTVAAFGPPVSADGNTYVGQTWDWMPSVFGLSEMVMWRRKDGPDLLGYAYPGLWAGAGLNSNGIALCWTSAQSLDIPGPRVGIPSYLLIAQMLYQPTLDAATEEARRASHAGWFTFGLADGEGNLASVEGSPKELAVETYRGRMARALYGTHQMTRTPEGKLIKYSPRCQKMYDLLDQAGDKMTPGVLKRYFLDPDQGIWNPHMTVDAMIFNTTRREAHLTRGLGSAGNWRTFTFAKA